MITIFKTSVNSKKAVKELIPFFKELLPQGKWNIDLEDCDKILRIESNFDVISIVLNEFKKRGFECEELSD